MNDATVVQSDAVALLGGLEPGSADLVFGSPPYEKQRTYGIGFSLEGQQWVDWMVEVFRAGLQACKGLVAFVVEGRTRKFRWSATPVLLMADLHRAGVHLRKPPAYFRRGICGAGGPDWWRNDYEFVVCATNGGRLPWSDNTALGSPPKYAPGGEMSYRMADGIRVNEKKFPAAKRPHTKRRSDGGMEVQQYVPPVIANPGNVIHCQVGGGRMGDRLCHENEAPFPESLAERFVMSFCPPGGLVVDPFSGSGTTGAVALRHGRRFLGGDVRESQVELTNRRLAA